MLVDGLLQPTKGAGLYRPSERAVFAGMAESVGLGEKADTTAGANNMTQPKKARTARNPFCFLMKHFRIVCFTPLMSSVYHLPIEVPRVILPPRGDVGVTDDLLDTVLPPEVCDEHIHRVILRVGIFVILRIQDLDTDGEIIHIRPAIRHLRYPRMIGDIRIIDQPIDIPLPIDHIVWCDFIAFPNTDDLVYRVRITSRRIIR